MLQQIENKRAEIKLSKTALCEKVGCNCKTYNNIVKNGAGNFQTIRRLCKEVGIEWLEIK